MIQFFLSKVLAGDMTTHISETQSNHSSSQSEGMESPHAANEKRLKAKPTMTWYAHRITLGRRKCIIAMEVSTRYAMVFCSMKKPDFERFPDIFKDYLWRQMLAFCDGIPEGDINQLSTVVLSMCEQQSYQVGHDRSVSSHIAQVAEQLAFKVNYQREALPVDRISALKFSVSINEILRKRGGDKHYFQPADAFQELCGALISSEYIATTAKNIDHNHKLREKGNHLKPVTLGSRRTSSMGNIIHVDFKNKC